jgi:hypothetical protein
VQLVCSSDGADKVQRSFVAKNASQDDNTDDNTLVVAAFRRIFLLTADRSVCIITRTVRSDFHSLGGPDFMQSG